MHRTETEALILEVVEPLRQAISDLAESCIGLTELCDAEFKRLNGEIEILEGRE